MGKRAVRYCPATEMAPFLEDDDVPSSTQRTAVPPVEDRTTVTGVRKNGTSILLSVTSPMLTDFQTFFTIELSNKFVIKL